ncbi:MAG: uncharacterized protein KVP18_004429 [Porospora cf. gigantea A]|uniref:uncharacterized protein n=1 Tax=Porospora cf. gigantea A TaxID=2853593 RepID=UPI003559F343|nr:MAG: hypothetical protein KVP18_004429 [Porospora cf. gigantea A]
MLPALGDWLHSQHENVSSSLTFDGLLSAFKQPPSDDAAEPPPSLPSDYRDAPQWVVGCDEAGRGPLAGPVVCAAATYAPQTCLPPGVVDSKQLRTDALRDRVFRSLMCTDGMLVAFIVISHDYIDRSNILKASLEGMASAAQGLVSHLESDFEGLPSLRETPLGVQAVIMCGDPIRTREMFLQACVQSEAHVVVDGNHVCEKLQAAMPVKVSALVGGDASMSSIAAASVVAKWVRDGIMRHIHEICPEYDFESNKGYGSAGHRQAIESAGVCPVHRLSYNPARTLLLAGKLQHPADMAAEVEAFKDYWEAKVEREKQEKLQRKRKKPLKGQSSILAFLKPKAKRKKLQAE